MKIKDGVRFATGEMAMMAALVVVQSVYQRAGYDCVITGGCEDRRPNNLHHRGWALDFRVNFIADISDREVIETNSRKWLGDGFDVILHGEGQNIHLHVEYDPKD